MHHGFQLPAGVDPVGLLDEVASRLRIETVSDDVKQVETASASDTVSLDEPRFAAALDGFEILGPLGAGGMGQVFLARDLRLGRRVALKALHDEVARDPERRRRFETEARALAALNHPNVAALYGIEDAGDRLILVLEPVDGASLQERLGVGPLRHREAVRLCAQVAAGLESAHAAGVIHRDLKPGNVLLTADGDAKLVDFGLARRTGVTANETTLEFVEQHATRPGVIVGTVAYMSPEQARGKPVGPTTDTWALGCLLYECLSGRQAFAAETFSDSIARILEDEPDWSALPADLPMSIRSLLRRCLAKDPRRRLQHAGDARIELEDVLSGVGSEASETLSARHGIPLGAVMAIALLAAVLGLLTHRWLSSSATRTSPPTRRWSIQLPEHLPVARADAMPLGIGRTSMALSPDARTLIYTAERDDDTVLVRRAFDEFEVQPLAGTEGGFGPFFSPDGTWVAYFTNRALRRVPVSGGSPLTVTEARNPFGGTWGQDDRIHFAEAEGNVLVSVSTTGGDRTELFVASTRWPQALPDGRLLTSGPVSVIDLANGDRTRVNAGTFARYLPSGHLVYGLEGSLFVASFDPRSKALGSAVPLPDRARSEVLGTFQLAVAGDGTMAYVPGDAAAGRTLVWADRTGNVEPAAEGARTFGAVELSPTGDRLAVAIASPESDIWIYDFDRRSFSRLTQGGGHFIATWSADGEEIYVCKRFGDHYRTFALPANGASAPRPLLSAEIEGCVYSVSNDGRWAVLDAYRSRSVNWDVIAVRLDGDAVVEPVATTPAYEWGAEVSPDGRWVVYTSDVSGRYEVYLQAFPKPEGRWQISTEGGEEPVWSDDGNEIVYRNGRRWLRVDIDTDGDTPAFASPALLIEGDFANVPGFSHDLAADGRLLLLRPAPSPALTEIRIVQGLIDAP